MSTCGNNIDKDKNDMYKGNTVVQILYNVL